ncbi:MAG: DUF5678 domain-containing protein [Thermoplasmata archaeon]
MAGTRVAETLDDVTGNEGEWIVVVNGKVVASSQDVRKMFELAEKYPREGTVVTRVLHPQASFY